MFEDLEPVDRQHIEQGVAWFYRTVIKQPRDTVEAIAAEHDLSVPVVQARIFEAERLLAIDITPEQLLATFQELRRQRGH